MGNQQSTGQAIVATNPKSFDLNSPDTDKNELLTIILMRLLEKTDIVDFLALTNGPGNCGSYVVLLEKELKKEFSQLQLQTTITGKKQVESFLYTKAKTVSNETPADTLVCRELALFYIRLLQLIGALTMSIYTPKNLVDRLRDEAYKRSVKKQQANIPLSKIQQQAIREAQWNWLRTYILSSTSIGSSIYTFKNKQQYKYDNDGKTLTFTDNLGRKFMTILEMEPADKFLVADEFKKPDSYWIILRNNKNKSVVSKRLVNKDGSCFIFSSAPNIARSAEPEEPYSYEKDWTEGLPVDLTTYGEPVAVYEQAPAKAPEAANVRISKNMLDELMGHRQNYKRGGTRKLRSKGGANQAKPDFGPQTTLPKVFQESYSFLKNWSKATSTWAESAPATYRSSLLFIKPNIPASAATSYVCNDNWSGIPMRRVAPFASLEALYRNSDNGEISFDNMERYNSLLKKFNDIYSVLTENKLREKPLKSFADIVIPTLSDNVLKDFCIAKSPHGEVMLGDKQATFETAQKAILLEYNSHFEFVIGFLKQIFTTGIDGRGEITIALNDIFSKNSLGARGEIENFILVARGKLAEHYTKVEELYINAILKLATGK